MAAVEKFKADGGDASSATCAMGLSLGEYSALCFAGAISFEDGVRITKVRGEAMQAASDAAESGMVSVIGLDSATTEELCKAASEKSGEKVRRERGAKWKSEKKFLIRFTRCSSQVQVANFLCKGNYAVSGSLKACAVVNEIAKPEYKVRACEVTKLH